MTTVRPVAEADSDQWQRMRNALWPDGGLDAHAEDIRRYFAGQRREPLEVLVAVTASGQLVGFVELSIRNIVDGCESGNVAYLEGLFVEAGLRRLAIGRQLVEAAESWATGQGCTELGSDADIDNHVSHVAHLGYGFEEAGCVRLFRKTIGGKLDRGS